ncbi:Parp12, partial [Symbiodinium sp. CCMP2456]
MSYSQSLSAMRFAMGEAIWLLRYIASRPIARGGQPPTLEPPFDVPRSTPPSKFLLEAFGEGLSRFIYSREAELERTIRSEPAEDIQHTTSASGEAAPDMAAIPDDDHEALLVARFAAGHDSSSESDQPKDSEPSAACGAMRSAAAFSPSEPDRLPQHSPQVSFRILQPAMANAPASELAKFLKDHAVHEVLAHALALKGLETVDDLAYAYPELEDMGDMGAVDPLHGVQAAKLRRALRIAHGLSQQAAQPSPTPEPLPSVQSALIPQASPTSWMENLPPKLSSEAVQDLVNDFKLNYPRELLDDDTMPSIRLLSLVQHSLKPGEKIRWIPWQFRFSAKQYQEIMEAKSSKPMRTEAHILASALYDDTPEMAVAHLRLSASWLSRIQTVFRNAWALCGAAHLNNLKAFDKKVLDLALPDLSDTSLRGPTTQELLAADRKIWGTIPNLVSTGWSLDEAFYEVTAIRRCGKEHCAIHH